MKSTQGDGHRHAPMEINHSEFRRLGKQLVDEIADHLERLRSGKVTAGKTPKEIRELLGNRQLPETGTDSGYLLANTTRMLMDYSLFNGHPRFFGYITSSPSPLGTLGDFLASAINQNVGSFSLAPVGTEIEAQTIRWIAEMIGYPSDCGGILVSGGNMANFVAFLSARRAKSAHDIRTQGARNDVRIYASTETHTWVQKAADMFGTGTDAIHWIPADNEQRMDTTLLEQAILSDKQRGLHPAIVIGTAGTVSTGAIDPLPEIASIARKHSLWFHVDGAYGAPAAILPEASEDLKGLQFADSVAVDPHKWLYAPLEVGCTLVRKKENLLDTFRFHVPYYRFGGTEDDQPINYYEYGPQNSRGFRALKVWLTIQQVGKQGYIGMIRDDIRLAEIMHEELRHYPELEPYKQSLSITTFRFVPQDLSGSNQQHEEYLNTLNTEILYRLQNSGEAYLSNAMYNGKFLLRACIVNFRTSVNDVKDLLRIIIRIGKDTDTALRQEGKPR